MALALTAGLQLEDAEFVQFHPTGLGIRASAVRSGSCRRRRAAQCRWQAFMERYARHADLAARDVVSRSIMAEIDARGVVDPEGSGPKDCVWPDMTGISPAHARGTASGGRDH